jgi:hypothetical protein
MQSLDAVTHVVYADEHGLLEDRTGVSVEMHLQDGGKTLKIFVRERPPLDAAAARVSHRKAGRRAFSRITGKHAKP